MRHYLILLLLMVLVLSCKNEGRETDNGFDSFVEDFELYSKADLKTLESVQQDLALDENGQELMDMCMAFQISYMLIERMDNAIAEDSVTTAIDVSFKDAINHLIKDKETQKVVAQNYEIANSAIEESFSSESEAEVLGIIGQYSDSIRRTVHYFCQDKYPQNKYAALGEDEYFKEFWNKDNCPIEVDEQNIDGEEAKRLGEELSIYIAEENSPVKKACASLKLARLAAKYGVPMTTDIFKAVLEDDDFTIYDYMLWRLWRFDSQHHFGASRYSHIPNDTYNYIRLRCLRNAFKDLETHPNDKFVINGIYLLSSENNIDRFGSIGNSAIDEMYYLGLL